MTPEQIDRQIAELQELRASHIPLEKCVCGESPTLEECLSSQEEGCGSITVTCTCGLRMTERTTRLGYGVGECELRITVSNKWNAVMRKQYTGGPAQQDQYRGEMRENSDNY